MNLYVGTSGYSYKEWKGTFYPKKLPAKQMLHYYSEHFRTVEINYTFRRMPTASVLDTWAGAVPADFQFVLKAPETINGKRLKEPATPTEISRNRRHVKGTSGAAAVSVAADFSERRVAAAQAASPCCRQSVVWPLSSAMRRGSTIRFLDCCASIVPRCASPMPRTTLKFR